ncbi:hypothetical protein C3496_24635 [Bacillus anthracis]|nr:hypothetical protein DY471_18865 [Bacillus anthracis]QBJ70226.1 hypothetical protein C3496_24635 [Bacillus anthracis]THG56909.1 hypothetical protein E7Y01_21355 [Bacillus sp. HUB-I-004]
MCPALTGSKTPPPNSAETKKLGGNLLPVNARLVRADNQRGMNNPPLIKVSLYVRVLYEKPWPTL